MTENHQRDILLVFPQLGSEDVFLKDPPLGLIYAAAHAVKKYRITILDLRLADDWQAEIERHLARQPAVVGISVYTGNPIRMAIAVSRLAKQAGASVVWGGPHPTVDPETTLKEPAIDYLVRGFGAAAFAGLLDHIVTGSKRLQDIPGISYRDQETVRHNPLSPDMEIIPYQDIPYQLLGNTLNRYGRLQQKEVLMPMFSSVGCPYHCSFCISPVVYAGKKIKWQGYPAAEIVSHIGFLKKNYGVNHVSFYDDDAFVDLARMKELLRELTREAFHIRISFRGARINEMDRADDELLSLLVSAGTSYIQIGVESGSERILTMINKDITIEQIIRVNQKLSRYRELFPMYNFMTGIPGETLNDLKKTTRLMVRLQRDNPNCFIGFPVKYKPQPGSKLFEAALVFGLRKPESLDEWSRFDSAETDVYFPWYSAEYNRYIHMMQVCSYFFDDKVIREIKGTTVFNKFLRLLHFLYHPIARYRIEHENDKLLIENIILRWFRLVMKK